MRLSSTSQQIIRFFPARVESQNVFITYLIRIRTALLKVRNHAGSSCAACFPLPQRDNECSRSRSAILANGMFRLLSSFAALRTAAPASRFPFAALRAAAHALRVTSQGSGHWEV